MKIIDAHIHLSHIESFQYTAKKLSHLDYSLRGLTKEMEENNVVLSIGMGLRELEGGEGFPDSKPPTPMALDMLKTPDKRVVHCAGVNPYRLGKMELYQLEKQLLQPEVVGIKIYLGYYPFYAYDSVYDPVYKLAKDYQVPVVFHTGDTYSERGLLKYAHPLTLDEVAVRHRDVTFVMAHFGDPWMLDAAEVVYKNRNMFADLSGLIVGDNKEVTRIMNTPHFFDHFKHALAFCDHYDKLLFGTDWPLVRMEPYIKFVKHYIPSAAWDDVFYKTALRVFPKIKSRIQEL
ncbi:amidohydrolase family protein [Evansella cellulosilytica]|uniref:Amidohydrolase 2 n=1 Tax=Evansella cellulosilytica (strain ATCC 21833 / DSM 2522 / FERM P-1141 / JCM 9156 / N-4) TaxID=649639 RepID=E6U251_EVAC2|nr:TatD family hydrolase [Evansella cellulosilytica]ADU30429.1 amidohydrolase 2 [Evansella cellulosilytica DSM 2522]